MSRVDTPAETDQGARVAHAGAGSAGAEGRLPIRVRPYTAEDHAFVFGLVSRLAVGIPPWRDPVKMAATAERWLAESIERHGKDAMVYVAEDEIGLPLGFATVADAPHFTGVRQAELGELAVSAAAEGRGAGWALVSACEQWAREQGYEILSLGTGAANAHARRFYQHLGFLEEDVTLVKLLKPAHEP